MPSSKRNFEQCDKNKNVLKLTTKQEPETLEIANL